MKVCLLYKDRDVDRWTEGMYFDEESILQDLGLKALFQAAGKKLIREGGEVKRVEKEDPWLTDTMKKVMMVPLVTKEEIEYRQAVLKDCFQQEELLLGLYRISNDTLQAWNLLGRSAVERSQKRNPVTRLADDIRWLRLFCDSLTEIRELLTADNPETGKPNHESFQSEGLRVFSERFQAAFSAEREESLRRVLDGVSFFMDGGKEKDGGQIPEGWTVRPRIVLECGLEDGLKFSSLSLVELSSERMRYYRHGSTMKKLQEFRYSAIPNSFSAEKDPKLIEQAKLLEYEVVRYTIEKVTPGMKEDFQSFFDQLKRQTAFYIGALHIREHMKFLRMDLCFPEISDCETLEFQELRELVMGIERRVNVIGNTCALTGKDLLIVTGANQGGKSTFLRSIGIAQVMAQCGLPVAAERFRSTIYPRIFVHFTRREDASMNSGRLDEELNRMNRIVEQIGKGSLLLLNESFATTTEKEASVIAYDITKALTEARVRILMVTHLLSFAQRVFEEEKDDPQSRVEFLSAERKPNGDRTFRMIQKAPDMTSFGLDLYEEIVEKRRISES